MTRDGLEALVWQQAAALCSPRPEGAMTAILAAVDAYAAAQAEELAALRTARLLAGCYAPDPAEVTARRRAVLAAAVSGREAVA